MKKDIIIRMRNYVANKIINFKISRGEDGFYTAAADDFGIYTQGKTFEDLLRNIKEATEVSFEELSGTKENLGAFPPIMMSMDFSEVVHA